MFVTRADLLPSEGGGYGGCAVRSDFYQAVAAVSFGGGILAVDGVDVFVFERQHGLTVGIRHPPFAV